jgi:NTP pyrophosphatase (non-canonical NTP hydrolase)
MRIMTDLTFNEVVERVIEIRNLFEKFEKKSIGKIWGKEEIMLGLVTDVGDLARLVLSKEGFRATTKDLDKALRHEMADCLWAIIILSVKYDIDLCGSLIEMSDDIKVKLKNYNS